jgi:hypothetical protein
MAVSESKTIIDRTSQVLMQVNQFVHPAERIPGKIK